ncbi:hypothetical protein VPH184E373B_0139 [Vibrio phage 184E37-3b]|nr:hypothetical protein MYOV056v2_p0120 [Vibrio phage 184E37.3a]QZI89934.1 hypothetical protein MYOV057v1_p0019 [Vibrio phage 184E37.1]
MSFFTKLGQVIDIFLGGFELPTEEQTRINDLSVILCNYNTLSKDELNGCLSMTADIHKAFSCIPEGRTVEAETIQHGKLTLQKINGMVEIIEMN